MQKIYEDRKMKLAMYDDGLFSFASITEAENLVLILKPENLNNITLYHSMTVKELSEKGDITLFLNGKKV